MDERGQERAGRPRRAGARCAGRSRRRSAAGGRRARRARRPARRAGVRPSSSSSTSGLSSTVTGVRTCSRPATFAAPKPGLPRSATTARAVRSASAAPPSEEPGVDDDELRRGGQVALDRAQQDLELGLGVVQDDEQRRVHAAASARTARSSRAARSHVGARARAAARGARAQRGVVAQPRDRAASPARRRAARRAAPSSPSISRSTGRSLDDAGVRTARASSGGNPKPSRCEGRTSASAPARGPSSSASETRPSRPTGPRPARRREASRARTTRDAGGRAPRGQRHADPCAALARRRTARTRRLGTCAGRDRTQAGQRRRLARSSPQAARRSSRHGRRVGHDARRPPREPRAAGASRCHSALVGREVARALLERAVVDRDTYGTSRRDRCERGDPHHVRSSPSSCATVGTPSGAAAPCTARPGPRAARRARSAAPRARARRARAGARPGTRSDSGVLRQRAEHACRYTAMPRPASR